MTENKKRVEWIDILRGFAILLVVLGHNNPPFVKYIYGFHMPLFFIVSGYLFNEELSIKEHFKHIFNRYVLTYFLLCFLNLYLYYTEAMIINGKVELELNKILGNIKDIAIVNEPGMQGCFPLWFLPVLAISLFIFTLLMKLENRILKCVLFAIIAITGFILGRRGIIMPFRFSVAFVAMFFIGFGYCIKKYEVFRLFDDIDSIFVKILIIIGLLTLGYMAINKNMALGTTDMSGGLYCNPILFITGSLTWSMFLIILFSRIKKHNIVVHILGVLGRHTVFFLAFDESANLMGGVLLESLKITHLWYVDFFTHLIVLLIYYSLFELLNLMIKRTPKLL